ncbi:MAG: RIP metalloprotease RseP [Candidatus Krumholzibacteria bacterium]
MVITLLAVAFVLGIAIIVHEFGHFIVAKKTGIFVKTFSIGFGRKLLKKRIGETVYTISAIPFGGYVKFAGELEETDQDEPPPSEAPQGGVGEEIPDSEIDPSRYFVNKSRLARAAVVFAGPFANYVLAIILYSGMLAVDGINVIPTARLGDVRAGSAADSVGLAADDVIVAVDEVAVNNWSELIDELLENRDQVKTLTVERGPEILQIGYRSRLEGDRVRLGFDYFISSKLGLVKRDGPAHQAGIRVGAVIESLNDTLIHSFGDIERIIHANADRDVLIRWAQDGETHTASIKPEPKKVPVAGSKTEFKIVGQIGVGPAYDKELVPPLRAIALGFKSSNRMVVEIVSFMKLLFTGKAGIDAVGGPILIGQMAGDMARWGFDRLIYFLAFLSINLGIFNLLPVLPFDGGHLTLFAIEGITRKRIHPRFRERLAQGGFVLLIVLMVVVVSLDLVRCSGSSPGFF